MGRFETPTIDIPARITFALILVALAFFILALRLWYLQMVKGEYFRLRSENNRIREVHVPAPRGLILDRNGTVLVKNRPAFNIELVTEDCPDIKATLRRLEEITNRPANSLVLDNPAQRKRKPFEPKIIMRDVDRDTLAKVVSHRAELPGIIVGVVPARSYVYGKRAAHLIGYISEITKSQLAEPKYARYMQGDIVGQYGLEASLEERLQGMRGLQRVEVNAMGTRISEFSFESERIGHDLKLTIDNDVQAASDQAFEGLKGAAVTLDANTGAILALTSAPAFDPNIFVSDMPAVLWNDIRLGPDQVLNNRATQGSYPPGSVFKVFMAATALSEGIIAPHTHVNCPGYYNFGGRPFRCHKKSGHGSVALYEAVLQSCNVYFYTIGTMLSIDTIHEYMTRFGLGVSTGLGIGKEVSGRIPSTEWKKQYYKRPEDKKWYPGETLSVAIGQGNVTITPLQAARALAALVNGGHLYKPYVVDTVIGNDGRLLERFEPDEVGRINIKPEKLEIVKKALVGVVNDARGTGRRARLEHFPSITVGGKTGTAQSASAIHYKAGGKYEDHAWFVAYAPADKPEIAMAVLVENGGHGGVAAAPIANKIMDTYFLKTRGAYETVTEVDKTKAN